MNSKEQRVLHLTLKKKWFDMVASGEKKEEYREVKPYWESRLCSGFPHKYAWKDFDVVEFRNGYSKSAPVIRLEWKYMAMREGNPEWGAEPGTTYFVIKLGKIIQP